MDNVMEGYIPIPVVNKKNHEELENPLNERLQGPVGAFFAEKNRKTAKKCFFIIHKFVAKNVGKLD